MIIELFKILGYWAGLGVSVAVILIFCLYFAMALEKFIDVITGDSYEQ